MSTPKLGLTKQAKRIITLPDGYNGHTIRCYAEPIHKPNGSVVLLRVAEPGKEYMIRWCHKETYEAALLQAEVQS